MTPHTLVVQEPAFPAAQLFLLFHGGGGDAQAMAPLAARLTEEFPGAMVVAVAAPEASVGAPGFQWFDEQGVDDTDLATQVASAQPIFDACVRHWQRASGAQAPATALIGFGQGAIMALESSKSATPLCARVIAISGRYAQLPESVPEELTFHFLHGKEDTVIPYSHTVEAAHHLRDLGADLTAEVVPFIAHELHPDLIDIVLNQLTTHVPKRIWADAMKASPSA
jgi:phospholipase/carboxylesterase